MAQLYPPIIDNSQTAFVWFGQEQRSINVYFTFQGLASKQIYEDIVLVELKYQGRTLFKTASVYEPFFVFQDTESIGVAKNRYYITITESMMREALPVNSVITVRLMALSKSLFPNDDIINRAGLIDWDNSESWSIDIAEQHKSTWSALTMFSPICQPVFDTYGALDYSFIIDSTSLYEEDAAASKLSSVNSSPIGAGHYVTPASTYYFKSVLSFSDGGNTAIDATKEKDYLEGYQVYLEQVRDQNDSQPIDSEGTGYSVDKLVEKTNGVEFIDPYWDPTRRAFRYGVEYDFEDKATAYRLTISYYTNKGYRDTVVYYLYKQIVTGDNNETEGEGTITSAPIVSETLIFSGIEAYRSPEKGSITVECNLIETENNTQITGQLIIQRAEINNYPETLQDYEDLEFKTCYSAKTNLIWSGAASGPYTTDPCVVEDLFAEPGRLYVYTASFITDGNERAAYPSASASGIIDFYTKPVALMVEDMFLSTKDATLKIRYNPDLTSFKRNVVDAITPTLGGAYPFVRRNGAQKYHTFNIGGLISYNSELYELNEHYNMFGYDENGDRYVKPGADSRGNSPAKNEADIFRGSLFVKPEYINSQNYNTWVQQGVITKEDLRVIYEKQFRDLVMDFLYNDQILLFKSQSEGLKFIRLSNVSFTPNKQLDRHIYSFTATATEVLDPTLKNYLDLFMEDEDNILASTYVDIYLLTGAYQYNPTSDQLYIGSFSDGGPDNPTVKDGDKILENSWTWNKETYDWVEIELGDNEIYKVAATEEDYDTWGVKRSVPGELPVLTLNDTDIIIDKDNSTLETVQMSKFDLLMRKLEED